jgi:hypothetical protein
VQLTNFNGNGSHTIPPGEELDLFELKVKKRGELCDPKSEIQLILKSNVTNMILPITCYDGKLQMVRTLTSFYQKFRILIFNDSYYFQHTLSGRDIKFGRVELFSNHMEYFSVGNLNPVEVRLRSWGSNMSWAQVDLVGIQKAPKEDLAKIQDFNGLRKSVSGNDEQFRP